MKLGLSTKIVLAFLLSILLLGGLGIAAYLRGDILQSTYQEIIYHQKVLSHLNLLMNSTDEMEKGLKNFLLSGDHDHLITYTQADFLFDKDIKEIEYMSLNNPVINSNRIKIASLKKDWKQEMTLKTIGGYTEAPKTLRSLESRSGKKYYLSIQKLIRESINYEEQMLATFVQNDQAITEQLIQGVTAGVFIIGLFITAFTGILIYSYITYRKKTRRKIQSLVSEIDHQEFLLTNLPGSLQHTLRQEDMDKISHVFSSLSHTSEKINEVLYKAQLLICNATIESSRPAAKDNKAINTLMEELSELNQLSKEDIEKLIENIKDHEQTITETILSLQKRGRGDAQSSTEAWSSQMKNSIKKGHHLALELIGEERTDAQGNLLPFPSDKNPFKDNRFNSSYIKKAG